MLGIQKTWTHRFGAFLYRLWLRADVGLTNYLEVYDALEIREPASLALYAALDHCVNYIDSVQGYGMGWAKPLLGKY